MFSNSTYTSAKAKHRLLQLPLAAITLNSCSNGKAELYLLEALKGLNYAKLNEFIESKMNSKNHSDFTKEDMKHLLTLAQSDQECEVLRHVVCKTSHLSTNAARKLYGWENTAKCSAAVENIFERCK